MTTTHWSEYHAKWKRLGPPLRPHAEVVRAMQIALAGHDGPTLLLGVTPELSDIASRVTAVDRSPEMIRGVWPGDTAARRAVRADWLALPFEPASFDAAVGDGSLNALAYPEGHSRLYAELERVLRPGACAVFRVFRRPAEGEPVAAVAAEPGAAPLASFHGFKWRFAMALTAAGVDANIAVQAIHVAFVANFGDRTALARRTGWDPQDIETVDVYRESAEVYSFPTGDEFLAAVPPSFADARFVEVGGYELAERCPLLVLRRA